MRFSAHAVKLITVHKKAPKLDKHWGFVSNKLEEVGPVAP